ncbi:UDP-2,4-diacetamido-2,4,6-trideoxy-beta-L-altropyranose hydrolase [Zavarzinella formosa]|uniref:UDP-2,4-diacetamido-2,4, 6-trideoxy-beta-L-altropyranose hydrolase n=1 Tax=Zavarzinella formosa TaxID=360055 RepID=UPI0002D3611F|nr:UDP-2,4-diacetamido-2,4,6-trideoxy-beta-L-altropyranose hydrolase [Zavarzinella formosa]
MSSEAPTLLIRADADPRMGTGHVMRCLALAQCWLDHVGPVTLAAARLPAGLRDRLIAEGVSVRTVSDQRADIVRLARELSAAVVVLDGYHFTTEDERAVREAGFPVLAMDDYGHTAHTHATWVLNQNLGASESLYNTPARLLLGSRYAMLRREFLESKPLPRPAADVARKILITMGGADPDNITGLMLKTFESIPADGLELLVVIGGSNPHAAAIEQQTTAFPHRVTVRRDVTDMPDIMRQADLAVTAGGTTTWELAAYGVPMIVVTVADNQENLAKAIHEAGLAVNLGWPDSTSPEQKHDVIHRMIGDATRRQAMSEAGRRTVDGWGVTRVVQTLQSTPVISLRSANEGDCRIVWEWANDSSLRSVSFSPDPIPWETHTVWFRKRLTDPACLFLIGQDADGCLTGMIRFDRSPEGVVVSVYLTAESRGKGYGMVLIRRGTKRALRHFQESRVSAWILPDNPASLRTFARAGYRDMGTREHQGIRAHLMVFEEGN